ncbi:hypothetical protein ANANG_G00319010 [Anguilla anguilla]|uniref:Uncharacterized protein n=1 Tax=Anguilla anguilla TaxID=7936 RepID=A0A9D3LIR1_ANGAN|nr:hypothetical protein ANANG_G00319010 [Anguilla anguilla]
MMWNQHLWTPSSVACTRTSCCVTRGAAPADTCITCTFTRPDSSLEWRVREWGRQVKPLPDKPNKELLQQVEDLYKGEHPGARGGRIEWHICATAGYTMWGRRRPGAAGHTGYHGVAKNTNGLVMKW